MGCFCSQGKSVSHFCKENISNKPCENRVESETRHIEWSQNYCLSHYHRVSCCAVIHGISITNIQKPFFGKISDKYLDHSIKKSKAQPRFSCSHHSFTFGKILLSISVTMGLNTSRNFVNRRCFAFTNDFISRVDTNPCRFWCMFDRDLLSIKNRKKKILPFRFSVIVLTYSFSSPISLISSVSAIYVKIFFFFAVLLDS